MRSSRFALIAVSAVLAGCAQLTTYNKSRPLDSNQAIFVDAKQRAIVTLNGEEKTSVVTSPAVGSGLKTVTTRSTPVLKVCAEPSPDALSAISANQGINLTREGKADLGIAFGLAEGAGSIGLRTQSIQLLRDALYRLCEAYVSGAISERAYETMSRRFQSSMVSIVAIEQLTGAVQAPAVVLTGKSESTVADKLADLTEKSIKARADASKAKKLADEAKAAKDKAAADLAAAEKDKKAFEENELIKNPPKEPTKEQQTQIDKLKKDLAAADEKSKSLAAKAKEADTTSTNADKSAADLAEVEKLYEQAQRQLSLGGASAKVDATIVPTVNMRTDAGAIAKVADTVERIATGTISKAFTNELCTTVLLGRPANELLPDATKTVEGICAAYLQTSAEMVKASANAKKAFAKVLENVRDADQALALIKAYRDFENPSLSDTILFEPTIQFRPVEIR